MTYQCAILLHLIFIYATCVLDPRISTNEWTNYERGDLGITPSHGAGATLGWVLTTVDYIHDKWYIGDHD